MKKPIQLILIFLGSLFLLGFILILIFIAKIWGISEPLETYVRNHEYNSNQSYTLIYEDKVISLYLDPTCESKCKIESKQRMEIESIDIEGETKNYTLYYKSPGEKGSQYRKTIIEHSDSIEDEMGYISERSDYNELMDLIWDLRLRGL